MIPKKLMFILSGVVSWQAIAAPAAQPLIKEELQTKLVSIIDSLATQVQAATDAGVEMAKEQLPLVARELLMMEVINNLTWVLGGALICAVAIFVWFVLGPFVQSAKDDVAESKAKGEFTTRDIDLSFLLPMRLCLPPLITAVGLLIAGSAIPDLLKPIIAPRVYLIEWCSQQLK